MLERVISTTDCMKALRSGRVDEPEFEHGSWRYRIQTRRLCVVVAFRSESELVMVSTWRKD
ncbi:MAG: hypothetical protein HYR85_14085 [Planctomycetes bacterium]|nr:hypothetical protein [Planctomycetota bacterium]MBI3845118.1 hypothetical protein [Planctomycetota bacterium]